MNAIIVATSDDLHFEVTMQALDAGLHVMCEKPLAYNTSQAKRMLEKAEASKVTHMVNFTYRGFPFFRFVRDLMRQGYVGRPYHCAFRYLAGYGHNHD